jgi:MFS transporter, DHA1 family, staphyloferrin A biosynthesis exporter
VRQSILHQLVPRSELPNAVTLYQMVFNGSMLFGPSIGGLLIPFIDTKGCFFVATIGNAIVLLTKETKKPVSAEMLSTCQTRIVPR